MKKDKYLNLKTALRKAGYTKKEINTSLHYFGVHTTGKGIDAEIVKFFCTNIENICDKEGKIES